MMRRRDFLTLLGGAVAWPIAARAQPADPMRRIGVLMGSAATEAEYQSYLGAFKQGLRQLGWVEGQNLRIDVRWNDSGAELARMYAGQLIGLMPDVILACSTSNLTAIQRATGTIPVVLPTKFELVINLKTAKEFGLTVPASLLARADEVIE